ncbi:hypothetical protein O3G_MSEX006279 [Manduca sexta]|uniref:Peptidase S1 domain-containing protein n=1 Tax=Manduca sexta TaxID=7130 RepID=A0A922CK43_MANSE|nr:hypothetical protein O3G_MSEX006279 [Manduca sexta]
MFYLFIYAFIVYNFHPILCQRRIVNGLPADNARYMAYFVKSPLSPIKYTAWLCGGCIIHPVFILTSTSCLYDVHFVYAIAGYKKYVSSDKIEDDPCTKRLKKKVVAWCRDTDFSMKIDWIDWWNWNNVGLARVESPYDFLDRSYLLHCSYIPTYINVNYHKEFQRPGRDVVTLGWGSSQYYRPEGDLKDYNEKTLLYGSSVIITKEECHPGYKPHGGKFDKHINKHWICIIQLHGRLDVDGNIVRTFSHPVESCNEKHKLRNAMVPEECVDTKSFRRFNKYNTTLNNETFYILPSRRAGICQNDHGGPLVTWIGKQPYVIGVATAFLVDESMRCRGPYTFSSTYCHSRIIHCSMRAQITWWARRTDYCGPRSYYEQKLSWETQSKKV